MSAVLVEILQPYRTGGLLDASDVHMAATLCRLCGEERPTVALAAALAARAPRLSHVGIDLAQANELPLDHPGELPWPERTAWLADVASSPLLRCDEPPLVLDGTMLYLHRYRRYELDVAAELTARASSTELTKPPGGEATDAIQQVLDLLLTGEGSDRQRAAVEIALRSRLTVLLGGPGTGKTTTVAALLASLAVAEPGGHVALAAPTGKAAARLGEALRLAASRLPEHVGHVLTRAEASTVHRLLGVRPGSVVSFRHDGNHPLPHDVVIVDETSMVSLPLMAHLLEAVKPEARLVLVGDPGQLVSVEAGTVLGDIAGPAVDSDVGLPPQSPLAGALAVLRVSRRFPPGSSIDQLANAVRRGDPDTAVRVLRNGDTHLQWDAHPADEPATRDRLLAMATAPARELLRRAAAGQAAHALAAIESFRVLCAHRDGPFGVGSWNRLIERRLRTDGFDVVGWYPGRPVLVTANDYANGVFNGDLGVVIHEEDRRVVAFPDVGGIRRISPARLHDVETVHATTIHKSQGSEFDHVAVILPPADSPLATRELLYTAITRARQRVTVVGDDAAVRAAVSRRVVRAGGLRSALWPDPSA